MAQLGPLTCTCGATLPTLPTMCFACGVFWSSPEHLAAEHQRLAEQQSIVTEPAPEAPATPGETWLPCGHPGTPGVRCEFCGRLSEPALGEVSGPPTVCLVLDGTVIALPRGELIELGRHSDWQQIADLLQGMDAVSRTHAAITIRDDSVEIRDLGSLNGTWIDDRELTRTPVTRPLPLRFRLGESVAVEIRSALAGEHPTPWTGQRGG